MMFFLSFKTWTGYWTSPATECDVFSRSGRMDRYWLDCKTTFTRLFLTPVSFLWTRTFPRGFVDIERNMDCRTEYGWWKKRELHEFERNVKKGKRGEKKGKLLKGFCVFCVFFSLPRKERKKERNQLWVNIVYWNCFVGKLAKARKSLWRRPRLLHHVINGPLCFADRFDS